MKMVEVQYSLKFGGEETETGRLQFHPEIKN